jgi:hypothetical protein
MKIIGSWNFWITHILTMVLFYAILLDNIHVNSGFNRKSKSPHNST